MFRMIVYAITLFILCACSSAPQDTLNQKITNNWKGQSIEKLDELSYLKTLKRTQTDDYIMYSKQGQFPTEARCQSLGGCMGIEGGCDHLFRIKEGKILYYSSRGDCFVEAEYLLKKSQTN